MKKILLLAAGLAMFMTSCSSDDSSKSASTGSRLTQIIETYDNGDIETVNFTYNGNKIVKYTTDYGDETLYTYTGNLITQELYKFEDYDTGDMLEETIDFEYDSNDRLIKSTRTDEYGYVEIDNFTYNTNGTVSFITTASGSTIANGIIYYNGNQPYKKEVTEEPGQIDEYSWTEENFFDNKVNPFNSVTGFSKIEIACPTYNRGFIGITNNVIEVKIDGETEWSSVFTYNSNDMPDTEDYTEPFNSDFDSTCQYIYN
ncbi:MAG: hypothetical protein R2790_03705 [Flavobacterium haoranii]